MCVSIEPCRMQQASSAVLAQSTECMMHTIGFAGAKKPVYE